MFPLTFAPTSLRHLSPVCPHAPFPWVQVSLCSWGAGCTDQGACTTFPPTPPPLPQLEQIRKDIRDFRSRAGLDKVIVLWTANTERFCELVPGLNDTAENLLRTIQVGARRG